MKTKSLTLLFIGLCLLSCNSAYEKRQNAFKSALSEILLEEDDSNKKLCIVLFVSRDHMCAECIKKEILNIKDNSWIEENIVIMGISQNKREFISNLSTINPRKIITIKDADNNHVYDHQLMQYLLFDKENKRIIHIFYPQPCEEAATIDYFESVKKLCLETDE